MSPIQQRLKNVQSQLPEHIQLVAVSKTKPISIILHAYHAGQRVFGENKVQELQAKYPEMPKDIQWHMIGHLQTNKVKYIAPWIDMIHSVDRMKLLRAINKEAAKAERTIDCLLQFHIAEEDTKFGLDMQEAEQMLESESFQGFENVRIRGVMGMATFTEDMDQVSREFKHLKSIFEQLKTRFFSDNDAFSEISMGMSGDYKIAIEEGATIVRIGSTIFGARDTH
ncbi:MAG: YggS family pyridoxal phosphate-dependent enzyme [Bacteroidales bacterium]|jgi:pyridoxal phosphate enzyme (YggS family)|nr:YggS family pyridoxal phosphate-dependent enzyme [Bacteroidales bacterium]